MTVVGSMMAIRVSAAELRQTVFPFNTSVLFPFHPLQVVQQPTVCPVLDARDKLLWSDTVKPYLDEPLWTDRDSYDAGQQLMVPLHAAFLNGETSWQQDFSRQFERFVAADPTEVTTGLLNRLHYFYLASRFLVLAKQAHADALIPPQLAEILRDEVRRYWMTDPAWQWDRDPFPGGIRERVLWKLSAIKVEISYYRAIVDEENFLFAIAADLVHYDRLSDQTPNSVQSDIVASAAQVYRQRVVPQVDGGWLFQPGVWQDHRDHAYAGNLQKTPDLQPLPVEMGAEDSSHSHRMALWLTSLAGAYEPYSSEHAYYEGLIKSLDVQLFDHVLLTPNAYFPAYRMTNFMDGWNGVYRWRYLTQGQDGYGPYELSGTFLLGWWSFLKTARIQDVYRDEARRFPLPENVIRMYVGPNTSRERNPLVVDPDSYRNGFRELLVRLAGKLCFAAG